MFYRNLVYSYTVAQFSETRLFSVLSVSDPGEHEGQGMTRGGVGSRSGSPPTSRTLVGPFSAVRRLGFCRARSALGNTL